jgi:hypothetical protein
LANTLAVALVAFTVGCGGGSKARTQEALGYLPANAQVVIGFNADAMSDPFASAFVKDLESEPFYRAWRSACGVEPIKAVERITIAVTNVDDKSGVLVVQGKELDKLVECTAKQEQDLRRDGDVLLFKSGDGTTAMLLVNDRTLVGVFGPGVTAAEVREVAKGGSSVASDEQFAALISKIDTGDTLWLAARGKLLGELEMPGMISVGASVDLGERISAKAIVRFDDEASAKALAKMARSALDGDLDKVDVSQDAGDVSINVSFSRYDTRKLMRKLGTRW